MNLSNYSKYWQKFAVFFIIACVSGSVFYSTYAEKSGIRDEYKIVVTNDGAIRGLRKTTLIKKIDFYSFKGIPFAKPPVNDLRFKVSNSNA